MRTDVRLDRVLRGAAPNAISRFERFHVKHPEVWREFKKMANEIRDAGHREYSAWTIINVIRWHKDIKRTEQFKISNGYIGLYARILIHVEPKFSGFFQLRPLTSGVRNGIVP